MHWLDGQPPIHSTCQQHVNNMPTMTKSIAYPIRRLERQLDDVETRMDALRNQKCRLAAHTVGHHFASQLQPQLQSQQQHINTHGTGSNNINQKTYIKYSLDHTDRRYR